MLCSDANLEKNDCNKDAIDKNINSINIDAISQIQKELDPTDMKSLVFLLYDFPETALQRLILYQRVSNDLDGNNFNLLYDWAVNMQSQPNWKYKFLEALTICQRYDVIRKLGFHVPTVKEHYLPNNLYTGFFINPMKKALYKLCENMTKHTFLKLKKTLVTYEINTTEYDTCELVLLELMCQKFITLFQLTNSRSLLDGNVEVGNLIGIIEKFPELRKFASELRTLENRIRHKNEQAHPSNMKLKKESFTSNTLTSTPLTITEPEENGNDETPFDFQDLYKVLGELNEEDLAIRSLKSDRLDFSEVAYPIKNTKRIGVCYIINQENFYPSKNSINTSNESLEDRFGSTRDKIVLEKTMSLLNFEVICHQNLDYVQMIDHIKNVIKYRVQHDDSIFMLCILSHGVRGHVYAADSVKVKVEYIQSLLDSDDAKHLRGIPKVLILQACQVDATTSPITLAADSPIINDHLRKLDFLIYWATAPEYEAFRDKKKGSIFIQILCCIIQQHAKKEHLDDLFKKVTNSVTQLCMKLKRVQVPLLESTLRKKLYLQIPE